ncbi:MAG TPA: Uma2 family endonuclease [Tepidisphaeraceae bacterium]|jgi:Uma2 family endonuclease|nr:Uma2 family endonuclease [Tepidisphaeraceae bacterium]
MALPQLKQRRFTPEEYYKLERDAAYKSDFYDGEIFDMSGGTARHSKITFNLSVAVGMQLRGKTCEAYESNLRVAILKTGLRTYPDVSIYCQPLDFDPEDTGQTTAVNPTVVFEVLSPSTERYDRGLKAEQYRQIDSLTAHVIVWQTEAKIEVFARDGDAWTPTVATGLDASIVIPGPDVSIKLADVYDRVTFD